MTTAPNETADVRGAMYGAESDYLAAGGPGSANFDMLAPYFAPGVVLHQAEALGRELDIPILQTIRAA